MTSISVDTRRKHSSSDVFAVFGFLALLILFYPELFIAKAASLKGDHWEQHYPWAFYMAQSLKQGIWPFWTSLIQCGFPIAAESQMGLFYLPNLLLYSFLPFQWAYAYMNLFHFFIAGLGTYLYCRKMGLTPLGAFVAGSIFVFGTGYGGAYYNITSLKTIAWFPWILWSFEVFEASLKKRYVFLTAFFISLSVLAGYLQVAVLALGIGSVYFLLRLFFFTEAGKSMPFRFGVAAWMAIAIVIAVLVSLPQLFLTAELATFSNRADLSEGYAYVGSLAPMALLTLVFPKLQGIFRGSCIYSGIFSIYFIAAAFFAVDKNRRRMLWLWLTVGIISLLLALGQWSPLYLGLIKLTRFYAFRIPAKFVIFLCFSLAVLGGAGIDVWRIELMAGGDRLRTLNKFFLRLMGAMLAIWVFVYVVFTAGRSWVVRIGQWLVIQFIYGKPGRPRTLDGYFSAVDSFADLIRDMLTIRNPWQIWALILIGCGFAWVWFMSRVARRPRNMLLYLSLAMTILGVDLYVFAMTDIKKDFDDFQNVLKVNPAVQILLDEKESGRVGRLYGFHAARESLPLIPSVNMLDGIEDIGGYSPLIMKRYFETIGRFGNVNDSNTMIDPEPAFVLERMPLLSALDVSHVMSARELQHPSLQLLNRDPVSGVVLYRNLEGHTRSYFISTPPKFANWAELKEMLMSPGFDPRKALLLENEERSKVGDVRLISAGQAKKMNCLIRKPDNEVWELETTGVGFFVCSNTSYPGWNVRLNGREVPILSAYGLFQAVFIPDAGKHTVEFRYEPYSGLRRFLRGVFLFGKKS